MTLTSEQAKAIIDPLHHGFDAAIAKGDLKAAGDYYAPEGVLIHKGVNCAYGRDQIRKMLEPFCVPSDTEASDEVFEATSGHIFARGAFHTTIKSSGAVIKGTFEQVYRKEGDKWLIIYDIFEIQA